MEKVTRRPSKKERIAILLNKLENWQKEGKTAEEAIEMLTEAQYDFLVDSDIDFDKMLLTESQLQAVQSVKKSARPSGLTYRKKYPADKMELFAKLEDFVKTQQGEIHAREKDNFRDLDFTIHGTHYRIVLSNPRKPKEKV